MIYEKAYAKINLALEVKEKVNNFHNVNNIMIPINLYDELFFEKSNTTYIDCEVDIENNICLKAVELFFEKYNIVEGVHIILNKNIPIMAGLAGGSTDAAAVLRGLNRLFEINATTSELEELASQLGSDVPFFLHNKISLCTGRGEIINPLDIDFGGISVLLIKPPFGLSTKEIYQNYKWNGISKEKQINDLLDALKEKDISKVDELIFNDLENVALNINSELKQSFNKIESLSYNVHISGSGPTIFILDVKAIDVKNIEDILPNYKLILCNTI